MSTDKRPDAWKQWFRENGSKLLLFARQQTRTEADAQDVLQDAIVRLWRAEAGLTGQGADAVPEDTTAARIKPPDLPLAYTAIRHAAIDFSRRRDRRVKREQASDYIVDDGPNGRVDWFGSAGLEDQERREELETAVRKLPDKFREVLTLKVWGEQTFAQIAEVLGIPQNTAASRYRYALDHLKKSLSRKIDD